MNSIKALLIVLTIPLSVHGISERAYKRKMAIREHIMKNGIKHSKSSPAHNDEVEDLFPELKIEKNIKALPQLGQVKTRPWSDDYWPIYKGVLGARYAISEFNELYGHQEAYSFIKNNPVKTSMSDEQRNNLSPSEKFDLLIERNPQKLPLTKAMWSQGERYLLEYGKIEQWMGICHGWAPASFLVSRPKSAIVVKDASNRDLKFYPSDIKALTSLLWAKGQFKNHFIGGRCNINSPSSDENGRVQDRDCRDNNPATFHLAITNAIGVYKKSFIMDATYDYEVWNQPINSYAINYVNPISDENVASIEEAIIKKEDFKLDPYHEFRSKNTEYIIGIHLQVDYIVESNPTHHLFDHSNFDALNRAYYYYDLELDRDFNIIGGEWYDSQHPDFLWRPQEGADALTYFDYYLISHKLWKGDSSLGEAYKDLAKGAAKSGSPLAYIVKSLIKLSQKEVRYE